MTWASWRPYPPRHPLCFRPPATALVGWGKTTVAAPPNEAHATSRSVTLCGVLPVYVDKSYTRDRYGPDPEDAPGDDAE